MISYSRVLLSFLSRPRFSMSIGRGICTPRNVISSLRRGFCDKRDEAPQKGTQGVKVDASQLQLRQEQAEFNGNKLTMQSGKGSLSITLNEEIKGPRSDDGVMVAVFTCGPCDTRMARSFTKHSYTKGVVLIRCQNCQAVHLIADNLGWFSDQRINVETMLNEKGEKVDTMNVKQQLENLVTQYLKVQHPE